MKVIQTHELSRTFGRRAAIVSLDLEVEAGEIYGFLGPNGAGKTTTIRMLTGSLPPSGGTASVACHDIRTAPDAVRASIGLLPESTGYYGWMTPVEYLGFFAQLYGVTRTDSTARILTLLEWVGLSDRRTNRIAALSRGMRARLGVARALIHRPRVVFLDEPTLGLDPLGQRDVLELIRRENRDAGTTVFLSSHALTQVGQLCTRVGILDEGRLVAQGTASELSQRLGLPSTLHFMVSDTARAQQVAADLGLSAQGSMRDPSHLVVIPRHQALPAEVLVRALDRAGVIVHDVTVDTPDLGDVFFALVRHKRGTR
jgi:ABC-2 type transport system ATP-binding protein